VGILRTRRSVSVTKFEYLGIWLPAKLTVCHGAPRATISCSFLSLLGFGEATCMASGNVASIYRMNFMLSSYVRNAILVSSTH